MEEQVNALDERIERLTVVRGFAEEMGYDDVADELTARIECALDGMRALTANRLVVVM